MPKETLTNQKKHEMEAKVALFIRTQALATNGVHRLKRAVRVDFDGENLIADLFPIVEYAVNIPQVAWELQETIKERTEKEFSYPVKAVNIYVQGVHVPDNSSQESDIH